MFATVVGMLAPPGKYKKFVSLVTGFILLSVMIAPLSRLSSQLPVTDWFTGLISHETANDSWQDSYTNWRSTYLRSAFEEQLTSQLQNLLTQNGFTVYDVSFTFPNDFSHLTSVKATVSREEAPQRVPFIRIQPVQIGQPQQPEACPTATAAKKLISEFYNLPLEHIYVTVR